MVRTLAHWEPDAIGSWSNQAVGLGHLALWTTAEAAGESCPFVSRESGIVVVADARIDNRSELMSAFDAPPVSRAPGDHELIARAYEKWGEACASHLVGDFAFVVWDPAARRVFCARDPLGIRPLYYFLDAQRFVFGTEMKAIFTHSGIPDTLNARRLALYVIGGHLEQAQTQFAAVQSLEAASALTVTGGHSRSWQYWSLDPHFELRLANDGEYLEAFEAVFQDAVEARLRASHPVGTMLSGGLDATTMTSVALGSRRESPPDLAYTWALQEGDDWFVRDERAYVDEALRHSPMRHQYIVIEPGRMLEDRPELRRFHDGPNWDLTHFSLTPTFTHARSEGIRVLLFGDGGDETASHFAPDYLTGLMMRGHWSRLTAELWAQSAVTGRRALGILKSELGRWRHRPLGAALFAYQRYHESFLTKATSPDQFCVPISQSCVMDTRLVEYLEQRRPAFSRPWRDPVRCSQIAALTGTAVMSNIAVRKRNTSVLHGIECRYPFLDRRVVEFCVSVPPNQHRHAGWNRRLLRRVAQKRIPPKIANRRDKTLTLPDLHRGIARSKRDLTDRFARWERNPRIAAFVDVARLRLHFDRVEEGVSQRRMDGSLDTGSFCRAVLLATFLEDAGQAVQW
jgi:asparagine synthase (glutamine-hydrolysing)